MEIEMLSHIVICLTKRSDLSDRDGSDADERRLEDVFRWLGFDVYCHRKISLSTFIVIRIRTVYRTVAVSNCPRTVLVVSPLTQIKASLKMHW